MSRDRIQMELSCPSCSRVERCDESQMLARLQQAGALRRMREPEPDLVLELFRGSVDRFACAECGRVGLAVAEASDDWDEWSDARSCESCGRPISRERLEVFSDAKLCAACQQNDETGPVDDVEYCPRCGGVMTTRLVSRGTSRYVMACPSCRAQV